MSPPSEPLHRLAQEIDPERTILLFGAGASHSSGAPTSVELCRYLEERLAEGERISQDLAELSSILEHRDSRNVLIDAIVDRLAALAPDQALIALAMYPWPSLYTTNYDRLVELAYDAVRRPLGVVRSNFDWENSHLPGVTKLFKLHGCISQDRSRGHRSSMIVTVEDYEHSEKYRQLLFDRLKLELAGNTVCIIGYSLRDPHIQLLVREALRLQREAAAPGRVHVVVHELDEDRAAVWRSRGVYSVVRGDLNDFAYALGAARPPAIEPPPRAEGAPPPLPHRLAPATIDVVTVTDTANPRRLFYGAPATFADIRQGNTFPRDLERELVSPVGVATILTGVAGTGKTTLARRLLLGWAPGAEVLTYEHRNQYPFEPDLWLQHERVLREAGFRALLLIDGCTPFQREINRLARELPASGALHLLLTAETSTWRLRQKDPRLFRDVTAHELSTLSTNELRDLRELVLRHDALRSLVDSDFLKRTPSDQIAFLESRCSADMFVCLKVLFSSESIDEIVLREFAALDPGHSEVYRYTAALEAAGALVHRQMVLRLCTLPTSEVAEALRILEGLVEEAETRSELGIYLWRTRHEVIAELLSQYKFSDPSDLRSLLERVVDSANPTYHVEMRTLREICNSRRGVRGLPDRSERIALYRRIASVIPHDNVTRHRLIGELLDDGNVGDAEAELNRAIPEVGLDPPLQRYRVRLAIARSRLPGLLAEDRAAILKMALNEAEAGMKRFPDSKYMFIVSADVAEEWFRVTREAGILEWAKHLLEDAQKRLLDPDLNERLRRLWRL